MADPKDVLTVFALLTDFCILMVIMVRFLVTKKVKKNMNNINMSWSTGINMKA